MITKDKIAKVLELYAEQKPLLRASSDAINKAKENSKNKIKIIRNGKEIELSESALWQEVYYNAPTDAREVLEKKYPEVFDISDKANAKTKEIVEYSVKELGFNPEQLTFSALIELVEGIVDYKLNK